MIARTLWFVLAETVVFVGGLNQTAVIASGQSTPDPNQSHGASLFQLQCSACHGADGKGKAQLRTPDFTSPTVQSGLSDAELLLTIKNGRSGTAMPAWLGKLSVEEIFEVAGYIRSLAVTVSNNAQSAQAKQAAQTYQPGDMRLLTLPTGKPLDRHGLYVNFAHRFAFDPAFSGVARGGALLGLDGFSLSSFGLGYGVTDRLSVSVYREPTFICRSIQMMIAYRFLDESEGRSFNATVRVSTEGQDNFGKNFAQNLEVLVSRSLTHRAQIYLVPTLSLGARRLFMPDSFLSSSIPTLPRHNTFSIGIGEAFDVRPTVSLVAEVIPTLVNGAPLGIHRPAYAFGVQKKIWRHAFTFGFMDGPATTVSQRPATRAAFLNDPSADKPNGLFIGFDIMRQLQ